MSLDPVFLLVGLLYLASRGKGAPAKQGQVPPPHYTYGWKLNAENPVIMIKGGHYRAELVTSGIASFATAGMVASKLQDAGFTDVEVTKDRPADWPAGGGTPVSWYVTAAWDKPSQTFDRNATSNVEFQAVWEAGP